MREYHLDPPTLPSEEEVQCGGLLQRLPCPNCEETQVVEGRWSMLCGGCERPLVRREWQHCTTDVIRGDTEPCSACGTLPPSYQDPFEDYDPEEDNL